MSDFWAKLLDDASYPNLALTLLTVAVVVWQVIIAIIDYLFGNKAIRTLNRSLKEQVRVNDLEKAETRRVHDLVVEVLRSRTAHQGRQQR